PLARFGMPARDARTAAHSLELVALRSGAGDTDAGALVALLDERLAEAGKDRHQPVWRKRISGDDIARARDLAGRVEAAVGNIGGTGADGERSVSDWARATAGLLEM